MTCVDGLLRIVLFVVIPIVSLYLCIERFSEAYPPETESQEKKP
jgi:hypothetical protein